MSPFPEVGSAVERADDGRPGMSRCKDGILSLNPLEEPGWYDLVQSQPGTSFFHSSSWAEVLHDTYGHSPHYFCAMNGSRLAGALPIMEVNSLVTGRRGVALPFTDECRFVAEDPASAGEILSEAMDFGRKRNWKYLEIRGPGRVVGAASPSLSFLGHELPLSGQPDQVFGRFESSQCRDGCIACLYVAWANVPHLAIAGIGQIAQGGSKVAGAPVRFARAWTSWKTGPCCPPTQ